MPERPGGLGQELPHCSCGEILNTEQALRDLRSALRSLDSATDLIGVQLAGGQIDSADDVLREALNLDC